MDSVSYTSLTSLSFLEGAARVWPDKIAAIHPGRRDFWRDTVVRGPGESYRVTGAEHPEVVADATGNARDAAGRTEVTVRPAAGCPPSACASQCPDMPPSTASVLPVI
ncbi:hypothetical protein [Amycolatopsis sp.]|uniref:hypothetical protein n=1 Tax=Amycolatopsis sp. TaxID=37632 RepID=UPI002C750AAC|nr:hypothetical protein [Amycolatopsis sp.]HVV08280.1 hypothetical protein [Amycolatopsis sp.]